MTSTSVFEEFILSEDKKAYLESIKTNSEYRNLMIHYCLNNGVELPEGLKNSVEEFYGERKLVLKKMLIELEKETEEQKRSELIRKMNSYAFSFTFNDIRSTGARNVQHTSNEENTKIDNSVLKSEFGNFQKILDEIYNHPYEHYNFDKVGRGNYNKIEILRLQEPKSQTRLLDQLRNYLHFENIGQIFAKIQKAYNEKYSKNNDYFNLQQKHLSKMTVDQIRQVADAMNISESIEVLSTLFQMENHVQLKECESAYNEKNYQKVRALLLGFRNKIKEQILYKELDKVLVKSLVYTSILLKNPDIDLTLNLIENPLTDRFYSYFKHELVTQFSKERFTGVNYKWNDLFSYIFLNKNDHDIHNEFLELAIVNEENLQRFIKYFSVDKLRDILVRNQTQEGGPIEPYIERFGKSSADNFANEKKLRITDQNKTIHRPGDKIQVKVLLKNIQKLEIRIFRVDIVNYLKKNKEFPTHTLDLTGLIPEKKQEITYSHPKHQHHEETFNFEELDQFNNGFFIIDFVGDGLMSRAVIQKGSLSLYSAPYEFGYKFYILDLDKEICTGEGTGLYIDGKFLPANENTGEICIPYDSNNFNQEVILIHQDYAFLGRVSVDRENYRLTTALIFNDEGILPGRKARLILRNKLSLNNYPISITKIKESTIMLELNNLEGITNNKVYENVELEDNKDYVLEFIVPNKLNRIKISIVSKIETVGQKEITLNNSETVNITRGENSYVILNGYLEQSPDGYTFNLKGRNGESIPDHDVQIMMKRIYDDSIENTSLTTNSEGKLSLGKLGGIKSIKFQYEGGELISCINDSFNSIDIPGSFTICQGEELTLPSTGLQLTTENFSLVQWAAGNEVLENCYNKIKSIDDGRNILLQGLEPGTYRLEYLGDNYRTLQITVEEAQRWKHSLFTIDRKEELREVSGEIRYLDISNINQTEENLEINLVSNDMYNVVVHAFAYHYNPRLINYMNTKIAQTNGSRNERNHQIKQPSSSYISEKRLGDEMRYVMDRKSKKSFIGNTLKKPSILLHRQFIKETTEDEENLIKDGDFDKSSMLRSMNHKMAADYYMERNMRQQSLNFEDFYHGYNVVSTHEYITNSGKTLANLNPDKNGKVVIPLSQFKSYSEVTIIAADTYGNVISKVNIGNNKTNKIDLRLPEAKEAGIIYTEDRFCEAFEGGKEVVIEDLKNTQSFIIEDLKSLFDALMVISPVDKVEINKWKFLVNWGRLSENEKLKKFDEFGGHELNIFTYLKDREFFDSKIKPILRYKSESEMIDYILTGNEKEFESKFNLDTASNISPLELVLLLDYYKDKKPEIAKKIVESWRKRMEIRKPNQAERNSKFDSIIASKKVDEEPEFASSDDEDDADECKKEYEECEEYEEECMDFDFADEVPQMAMAVPRMAMMEDLSPPPPPMAMRSMAPPPPMGGGFLSAPIAVSKAPVVIERYKKAGAAFEFGERHQYFNDSPPSGEVNNFWLDIAENIVEKGSNLILSENFMDSIARNYMIIYSLAFTNLPFKAGKLDSVPEGQSLKISSTENFLVICKKMEEKRTEQLQMDLIISQKFYDPNNMYTYDEKDTSIKRLKEVDEFLIGKRYSSRITFTNISENYLQLKVIVQIPQGAMPLYNLDILKIHNVDIGSLSTQILNFDFYFPSVGEFSCYPATIVKNNRLVTYSSLPDKLKAVEKFERGDKQLDSLQDILNYGSEDDIIQFMEDKNLFNPNLFNINKVLWLFKEKKYYEKAIRILRDKCYFNTRAWSYSIHHGDYQGFLELIRNTSYLENSLSGLQYFNSKYVKIDVFKPLEYDPLINPRAHSISEKKHNILNKNFKTTYENFLRYCSEKTEISARDNIILTAYFILQDRIEDALKNVKKINEDDVLSNKTMLVQFNYIKAYLSIYEEYPKFETARQVCKEYSDFSDISWRKMFQEIQSQLDEFDGAEDGNNEDEEDDSRIKHKSNKEMVEKAEYLKAETKKENNNINVTYMNIPRITVKFFKLDMEILFSTDPFLEKNTANFSFVNPNSSETIEVPPSSDFANITVKIPEELQTSSLFVFVQGGSKSCSLKVFNSNLKARVIEDFGMLKVSGNDGKLLSKIYVKCFYKPKSGGEAKFYKDGYTDFRGSFDYASLNSDSLDKVEKFSILVVDDEFGATIVDAVPPRKVGEIKNL